MTRHDKDAEASFVLDNAEIVHADRVSRGWLAVVDGQIAEVGEGRAPERGIDLEGDFLIPGLIELHTDHLESHYAPRPKVRWHPLGAVLAYDAQMAASGITTVFDSLRAGTEAEGGGLGAELEALAGALEEARSHDLFRSEHLTHLRCELSTLDVMPTTEKFLGRFTANLISMMDHTPGQRQFRDLAKWFVYYGGRTGKSEAEIRAFIERKSREGGQLAAENRPRLVALAKARGIKLASHDDTTEDEVRLSAEEGVAVAEFPTTIESARACHAHKLTIVGGSPNLIRGGSHSGNVAAGQLAAEGLLDVLSSDYVPGSLLMGAFMLPKQVPSITLPAAIATVSKNPADATGLVDRGEIAVGKRADLVRVKIAADVPVARRVWRQGRPIA